MSNKNNTCRILVKRIGVTWGYLLSTLVTANVLPQSYCFLIKPRSSHCSFPFTIQVFVSNSIYNVIYFYERKQLYLCTYNYTFGKNLDRYIHRQWTWKGEEGNFPFSLETFKHVCVGHIF